MVDFKKLREESKQSNIINPIDIFQRLPKPEGINDLYTSQAEVLSKWFAQRNNSDNIIKLHTGGGKTLVGLLIAQSVLNETHEPVLYLCPNNQLVSQTYTKSEQYGIPCIQYYSGSYGLPEEFLSGSSILIANYHTLFNGKSKFGVKGSGKDITIPGAIILDDAHVSNSMMRDLYSLKITQEQHKKYYDHLVDIFRSSFKDTGKGALFSDTVNGDERYSVLEIPYWAWKQYNFDVQEYLRKNVSSDFPFCWPLIRDAFEYCHAFITYNSFVITPYFPLMDLIPSFTNCKRRIYMSATIADDSSIIRTFNASRDSVAKPITSHSLAGVGERMILIPEWMELNEDSLTTIEKLTKWLSNDIHKSVLFLTPSSYQAKKWNELARIAESPEEVDKFVNNLQNQIDIGPYVFSNRYDGIDLPGDACRILILSNIPRGINEYENFLINIFEGSLINNSIAQKVEQGIGRGSRGSSDYCVVLIFGNDVLSWLARKKNLNYLTKITRSQLQIGETISKSIENIDDVKKTIISCLHRDSDWIKFHSETLANLNKIEEIDEVTLDIAMLERKCFQLWRDNYHDKAINKIQDFCNNKENGLENDIKGWLLQFAARIAYFNNDINLSTEIQQNAYAHNNNLFRFKPTNFSHLLLPSDQANQILANFNQYSNKKGILSKIDDLSSFLCPESTSNQFESAFEELGRLLGFSSERPEKKYNIGPDLLWMIDEKTGVIFEAKSRKKSENPLSKENHGQLLNSEQWFLTKYANYQVIRVSIHPNKETTSSFEPGSTKVLTYENLNKLISNCKQLYLSLLDETIDDENLSFFCQSKLKELSLTSELIADSFFEPFN
jgi:replicative superfamily II helicase